MEYGECIYDYANGLIVVANENKEVIDCEVIPDDIYSLEDLFCELFEDGLVKYKKGFSIADVLSVF